MLLSQSTSKHNCSVNKMYPSTFCALQFQTVQCTEKTVFCTFAHSIHVSTRVWDPKQVVSLTMVTYTVLAAAGPTHRTVACTYTQWH